MFEGDFTDEERKATMEGITSDKDVALPNNIHIRAHYNKGDDGDNELDIWKIYKLKSQQKPWWKVW